MSVAKGNDADLIAASPILASDSNHGLFTCQRFTCAKLSHFVKSFALTASIGPADLSASLAVLGADRPIILSQV